MESMTPLAPPLEDPLQVGAIPEPAIADDTQLELTMHPAGYRLLVEILPPEDTMKRWLDSKLAMPPEVRDREWGAQMWAVVLALGPEAYKDEKRFQAPWCEPGNCIIMRPYSGTRFLVRGRLYALINDDTVLAVVTDPSQLERA